jgi:hypothetical protein
VDGLGSKSLTLISPLNSGARTIIGFVVVRSHKAHGGMALGAMVWVAIVVQSYQVPPFFLAFPPLSTPFPTLVGVVGPVWIHRRHKGSSYWLNRCQDQTRSWFKGGGGVGGSKYHTRIPKVRLGKLNVAITCVLTILRGGNKKGTGKKES